MGYDRVHWVRAMARLRKLGKGGRYFIIFCDARRTPKERSVPLGTSDGRCARQRANLLEDLADRGRFSAWAYAHLPWEGGALTLEEAAGRFLAARAPALRPASVRAYGLALRGLQGAAGRGAALDALTAQHVRRYVAAPEVSPATQRHRLRHVRAFTSWCREAGLLDEDPAAAVRLPKAERAVPAFLTRADLERLLAAVDAWTEIQAAAGRARVGENLWLKDVVLVAAYTGLRLGELCAARWGWVDLDAQALTVRSGPAFHTKTGRERVVPLAGPAWGVVARRAEERGAALDGPLLVGPRGGALDPERTSKAFKRFVRVAQLDDRLHFHSLRHSCGSMLACAGVPAVIIAEVLGHASTVTTAIYTHAAGEHVREAVRRAFA